MLPHLWVFGSEGELGEDMDELEAMLTPPKPRPCAGWPKAAEDSRSGDFMVAGRTAFDGGRQVRAERYADIGSLQYGAR